MTLYAGWRDVVAAFVARRTGTPTKRPGSPDRGVDDAGVALAAHEHWLARGDGADAQSLRQDLADAFDAIADGLPEAAVNSSRAPR